MSKKNNEFGLSEKDMSLIRSFDDLMDMKEYAMDMIDIYTNEDIAQMVREGILTIEEVEAGLRRRITA